MAAKIIKEKPITHPIPQQLLAHGQIYEGSDGLLYVGIDVMGCNILAVSLNDTCYIDNCIGSNNKDELITFRVVNAKLTYQ